ncbi:MULTISPECIES: protein phosphatase CheZ [unclassified Thioalkalivibrio]|uniref:protein phosphatase CheZ n=1 Tax=unclassified Thioalkalivibrio TaxID=2621013 RepID=UPI00036150E0|nr:MULTISPECIES: protein phosphatase CheZ [unclassified Thioalkalivibrio]PYG04064.1 chemotaxis phosphatase CheZ [Thioalkalivibrio sp. ALE21]
MTEQENASGEDRLALARELVGALEGGDEEASRRLIQELARPYERELFDELGKLTRELHEALESFRGDSRLVELAQDEIPDARERLSYVVTQTEQATHETLNAVESSLPIAEAFAGRAAELTEKWTRFRNRELSVEEFREFARELDAFFEQTGKDTEELRRLLSQVLMAQSYQDLTGQVIRRVIRLVTDLEESLVSLIRLSSGRLEKDARAAAEQAPEAEETAREEDRRGHGPAVPHTQDSGTDVVQGQDEVDDLLSSLGF